MSDACGCSDDADGTEVEEAEESTSLWQVSEIRAAALAAVVLGATWLVSRADVPHWIVLAGEAAALIIAASTFVPGTLRRLRKGRIGVGTLMTIAAVGAVILGQVEEAAMLAILYSISEGLEEYSLARTRRGLRALLDLVPTEATVLREGRPVTVEPATLAIGEVLLVRPGERIATDGVIRSGATRAGRLSADRRVRPGRSRSRAHRAGGFHQRHGRTGGRGHHDRRGQLPRPDRAHRRGRAGTQGRRAAPG